MLSLGYKFKYTVFERFMDEMGLLHNPPKYSVNYMLAPTLKNLCTLILCFFFQNSSKIRLRAAIK